MTMKVKITNEGPTPYLAVVETVEQNEGADVISHFATLSLSPGDSAELYLYNGKECRVHEEVKP